MSIRLGNPADPEAERKLREMNQVLVISSIRQHELVEKMQVAEEALRKSEEWRRLVFESAGLGAWSIDPVTFKLTSDELFRTIFGVTEDDLDSDAAYAIIHPDDRDSVRTAVEAAIQLDDPVPIFVDFRVVHQDGAIRWVHCSGRSNIGQQTLVHQFVSFDGVIADITDERVIAEALRETEEQFRAHLEREVERRTAELLATNEQLQGFTSTVAHDLRQNIRGINTNASMLLSDCSAMLDEDGHKLLHRLVHSSKNLAQIVDDLLQYARLGRKAPDKTHFDLSALAEQTIESMRESGTCREGTQINIVPGLPAHGDHLLIRIVLENLLDNACKYSSGKERSVIEVGREGDAFFVRDNGIGFDMAFHDKLFLPFERLHHSSEFSGTGIGLANVKRIVEKHGGKVWAEGKPGEGATFYFSLP